MEQALETETQNLIAVKRDLENTKHDHVSHITTCARRHAVCNQRKYWIKLDLGSFVRVQFIDWVLVVLRTDCGKKKAKSRPQTESWNKKIRAKQTS